MAYEVVGYDTFTEASDTSLDLHTPDQGNGWGWGASSWNVDASLDVALAATASTTTARKEDDLGTDKMRVTAFFRGHATSGRTAALCARLSSANNNDSYQLRIVGNGTNCDVFAFKVVGGVETQLGTLATGVSVTQRWGRIEILDGEQRWYYDDLDTPALVTNEPDSVLAGRNYAGMRGRTSNMYFDEFESARWVEESGSGSKGRLLLLGVG